ncbi:nucleoid-associated protein [Pantoea rodasii]|uniref:Nucleoid-associated protein n=1 Tax=Pantoea rodasii TaxID=1076549 RepID=A0A2M9WBT2_9GAMM|nr:nucleoid-associated protein [Pantoea rodasii]PJZ04995.1 nucleoid-associated protein [Pantoea rodasii]
MSKINIKHVIVHELIKEAQKDFDHSKPYNLRDTELDKSNKVVQQLVDGVVELYGTKGNSAHYGIFIQKGEHKGPIPELFNQYHQLAGYDSDKFIELSQQIMKQMFEAAKSQPWSSGGYVVFSDYVLSGMRYLIVTMIKKTNGVTISDNLEPEEMIHLELSNINQAAKINFRLYDEYQKADEEQKTELSYLSFINKVTGQSAAAYFIAALGCDKGTASAGATRKLPNEAKRYFKKHQELMAHADNFRNSLISYMETQFKASNSARLSDVEALAISKLSFLDEEKRDQLVRGLMKHLNNEDNQIPTEFVINKTSLDKIRNVIFKDPDSQYSFNFDKDLLGTTSDAKIFYDDEKGNLTFNHLPLEAKTKIKKAINEMGMTTVSRKG